MFGYVMANPQELRPEQRERYLAVIAAFAGPLGSRIPGQPFGAQFDMVFLALLLSSLYEPAEEQSSGRCLIHPLSPPALAAERGHTLRSG